MNYLPKPDRRYGAYKFVKVNGEYRFSNVLTNVSHRNMVFSNEKAESAGIIGVNEDDWTIIDSYSMTLKISFDDKDEEMLTKLLGKPKRND